jgi:hypothetical protein
MDGMKNGEVREFRHLRHGVSVPDGWKVSDQRLDTHHQQYSVLIEKEKTDAPGE